MTWYLKDIDTDEIFNLEDGTVFGRSAGTYMFPNSSKMSRSHCQIFFDRGNPYLVDLESRNGTFVNSQKIPAFHKTLLSENCIVIFGNRSFIVKRKDANTSTHNFYKKFSA